jgi:diguanylate cyclase (GGDEF)-like protein
LSACLTHREQLVGVLSLYSETPEGFNEDHGRVIEVVTRQIGHTFKRAAEFDSAERRDSVTGLPNLQKMEHLLASMGANSVAAASQMTLIFIDVVDLKGINRRYGRRAGDEVLRHVATHARAALRVADILFRYVNDAFVAILSNIDPSAANTVATRIRDGINQHRLTLDDGTFLTVTADVTCVLAPSDGRSIQEVLLAAHTNIAERHSSVQVH